VPDRHVRRLRHAGRRRCGMRRLHDARRGGCGGTRPALAGMHGLCDAWRLLLGCPLLLVLLALLMVRWPG